MASRRRVGGRTAAVHSVACALVVVPLAQVAMWAVLRAVGGESGALVLAGVGGGSVCGVYAFGPIRWLADPDIAGRFGWEYPLVARAIFGLGVALGIGVAVAGIWQS